MSCISVIIVSFNTRDLLRDCLLSLRACTLPLRVVVVDNCSRDGTPAMLREKFPEVELLEPGRNLGFAGGNNLALRALGYRLQETGDSMASPVSCNLSPVTYTLLLNPDTVVHPGAIETLAAFLDAHPRVGMVAPRLLNTDGTLQPAAFRFPTLSMTALDLFPPGEVLPGRLYNSWWHGRYPQEHVGEKPFPIDHPLGACMLVRQEVIAQVGGLDEHFFMYAEEVDWCFRICRAGWSIWQEPGAQVTHVGGASTRQFRSKMLIALWESRLLLLQKHRSPGFVRTHRAIVRLGMLREVVRTWRDFTRRRLDREQLRARLWAFGRVFQL